MTEILFVRPAGVFVPDTATLQDEVVAEWDAAFGQPVPTAPDTPSGLMIAGEVLAREGTLANIAQIANQINPNIAEGVFLDAIWALTGGRRIPATNTIVQAVTMAGVPGSIIPAGALAKSAETGVEFQLAAEAILDGTGNASGDFIAITSGPIQCDADTLTSIVSGVIGWETVTNPTAATIIGSALESDEQSRDRRRNTLAIQGVTPSEAIVSGLYGIVGVYSVAYRENTTSSLINIDGVELVPHSIWACVDGGSDDDIAAVLLNKKSCGANWNGAVTVNVLDIFSGQYYPVQFDRPTEKPCKVRVTIKVQGAVSDPIQTVKDAIMAYANGFTDSETGLTIGVPLSAFELSGAINAASPLIFVTNCEVAQTASPTWATIVNVSIFEKITLTEDYISVTVQ